METTNTVEVPLHYNPNQLVTYKVIDLGETEQTVQYPTVKVVDLEWELDQGRRNLKTMHQYISRANTLEERLSDYLDMDAEEIIADICSIFGFNPTKEVEFETNATITGTISVPLSELANFDINDLELNVSIDPYPYDIDDYNIEIDHISLL